MKKLWPVIPFALVVFVLNFVFSVIPYFILRLFFLKKAAGKWAAFNATLTSRLIMFLVGGKSTVTGNVKALEELKKSDKPVCFVANHMSMLDIPAVIGIGVSAGFIAKKEIKAVPVLNLIALSLNSIFIDRKSLRKSAAAIKKGIKNIQNGYPMLIFPEGTRSKNGSVAPFKHGSFKLATQSNATVVPLVLKGTRELLENRKKIFTRQNYHVHILDPVDTSGLDRDGIFAMEEFIEKEVRDSYEQL